MNLVEILGVADDSIVHPEAKVCEFIQENSEWNVPKLKQVLNNHPIVQKIQGIPVPIYKSSDSLCWGLNILGNFLTKSATWVGHGIQTHESPTWSYKWIWNIDTLPKIKIFL